MSKDDLQATRINCNAIVAEWGAVYLIDPENHHIGKTDVTVKQALEHLSGMHWASREQVEELLDQYWPKLRPRMRRKK